MLMLREAGDIQLYGQMKELLRIKMFDRLELVATRWWIEVRCVEKWSVKFATDYVVEDLLHDDLNNLVMDMRDFEGCGAAVRVTAAVLSGVGSKSLWNRAMCRCAEKPIQDVFQVHDLDERR